MRIVDPNHVAGTTGTLILLVFALLCPVPAGFAALQEPPIPPAQQQAATDQGKEKKEPEPSAPQATEQSQVPSEAGIALNLENADLYQVLRIIGTELKIVYVVDPAVKGTVNINTAGTLSRADLFSLLQTILQVNGAMIVPADGHYQVVPIATAKQAPIPLLYAKEAEVSLQERAGVVLQIVPMRSVSAVEMGKLLSPFVSPTGQVVIQEQGNILLITETPRKLQQLREIIDVFDAPAFARQRIRLFPVVHNLAKNVIAELQSIFAGYALSTAPNASAIRFVPLERINSILAISPSPDVFAEVDHWVKTLDQPSKEVGLRNFVYKVQNAKASDIRDILVELYGGQVVRSTPPPLPPAPSDPMIPASATQERAAAVEAAGITVVQGQIRFIADEKNNALIIQAAPHDFEIIEQTIQELDVLPRQVLIDARIYEVKLTGDLSFGVSWFLDRKENLNTPLTTTASFSRGQTGGSLQASTFAVLSDARAIQLFLTAEENRSRVRTLSAPSILVTDNTSARIQVGSEEPVPIGSALSPIQSGGTSIFAQTIQFRDTGVILAVKPRINASGVVTLELIQEVSSASPNLSSEIVAPVINKSAFQTTAVLQDGETLAIGGIIANSETMDQNRVPVLGSIPGLGLLFGSTQRRKTRTEIILLLTPHVIQTIDQARAATAEFTQRMREIKKLMEKSEKKE